MLVEKIAPQDRITRAWSPTWSPRVTTPSRRQFTSLAVGCKWESMSWRWIYKPTHKNRSFWLSFTPKWRSFQPAMTVIDSMADFSPFFLQLSTPHPTRRDVQPRRALFILRPWPWYTDGLLSDHAQSMCQMVTSGGEVTVMDQSISCWSIQQRCSNASATDSNSTNWR